MPDENRTDPFDLVILAGGLATRLGPLAAQTPKALLPIGGTPFIALQLGELSRHSRPRRIIVTVRKGAKDKFINVCNKQGYTIEIIEEEHPLGTGGAILAALAVAGLSDPFVVVNGDVFFAMDIPRLCRAAKTTGAAIAAIEVPDASRFGALEVDSQIVRAFHEKGVVGPGLVNAGLYAFTHQTLKNVAPGAQSFETQIAPALAAKNKLAAVTMAGPFIDIGTPESFAQAKEIVRRFIA